MQNKFYYKDVIVPDYLQIYTPNPMTDDVSKSIIIPYGLNINLTDTQFTIYNANQNKNITIPRGLRINNVNSQLLFHLPNEIITNNTSPNMITIPYGTDFADVVKIIQNINSLFKFNTDSNGLNPTLYVYDKDNTKTLFKIDKTKSIIQLGGTNTQLNIDRANESLMLGSSSNFNGSVKINANELNIYANLTNCAVFSSSPSGIKYTYNLNSSWEINIPYQLNMSIGDNGIIFHKHGDEITNDTSPNQLEIPFGMKFDYDENNLIIRQPGSSTKGVRIPWETL
jgi:hypothetical protein